MSAVKNLKILATPEPITRLNIVKGTKTDNIPIPPISPATPIIKKGNLVCWQLQLDFTKPVQPLATPRKPRDRKPRKAKPAIQSPAKPNIQAQPQSRPSKWNKMNRLQKLKWLAIHETEEQKEVRLAKGDRDSKAFLNWLNVGIDHKTGEPVYKRFMKIARSETLRNLNKTRTLRGLHDSDAEQIWMDHYHDTILKVTEALADGVHVFGEDENKFHDYFWTFLKLDGERNVRNIDKANVSHTYIYADSADDDNRGGDIWGMLGKILSELPTHLEGRLDEFREYAYYEIFRTAETEYPANDTDAEWLDVQCFTTYFSTRQTLEKVAASLQLSTGRVAKGRDKVKAFIMENITVEDLQQAFGRKIMEGCNCG